MNPLTGPPPNPAPAFPKPQVEVIPIGPVDGTACDVAAAYLQALMGFSARIQAPWPVPAYAHLPARRQYDAGLILKALGQGFPYFQVRLGITALDLCLPILSYVFGEAFLGDRLAVISLYRLGSWTEGSRVDPALFYERLAKLTLHEVSHALGVPHCREKGCLMRFSQGLKNLDGLTLHFCPKCQKELDHLRAGLFRATAGPPP